MGSNQPAILEKVEAQIAADLADLHPAHQARFESMRVPARFAPLDSVAGEYVYVVAEYRGKVLYYSDVDNGWGMDIPDANGRITDHAGELLRLPQLMNRLFGKPNLRTCRG